MSQKHAPSCKAPSQAGECQAKAKLGCGRNGGPGTHLCLLPAKLLQVPPGLQPYFISVRMWNLEGRHCAQGCLPTTSWLCGLGETVSSSNLSL